MAHAARSPQCSCRRQVTRQRPSTHACVGLEGQSELRWQRVELPPEEEPASLMYGFSLNGKP